MIRMSLSQPVVSPPRSRAPRGRGSTFNPKNRYAARHVEALPPEGRLQSALDAAGRGAAVVETTYLRDASRRVIARNDSPDVGFDASVNPYRGCEHGCVYCYARPTHEFLGYSAGLDFESRILVKMAAPALLRAELSRAAWTPQPIALSGVTDPYQPIERRLRLTRGCLEVLHEFRNPVCIVTKSHTITRDVDLLAEMAAYDGVRVSISITTLNARLARALEPRASGPARRLHAVHRLAEAGVPVGVMVAPVIPGLTDAEVPSILDAAARAGAGHAGYTLLRLPGAVRDVFTAWLEQRVPDRQEKVLNRLRSIRDGALGDSRSDSRGDSRSDSRSDSRFHKRMGGTGPFARQVDDLFRIGLRRTGLTADAPALSSSSFRRPLGQLRLF